MEATIEVGTLRDAVGRMATVVDKKTTRPVLSLCMIEANQNDGLTFTATDLEVATKIKIPAKVTSPGKFCINPKSLFDVLRELPDENVELKIQEGVGLLRLKLGQINFSLLITSTEEFPVLSFSSDQPILGIKCGDLKKIIEKTSHAISNDETRVFLNGIFFQSASSVLKAVATDGYRLALVEIPNFKSTSHQFNEGFILPKKGVVEIKKIVDLAGEEELKIQLDDTFLYLNSTKSGLLAVRLIAREFPNYKSNIPTKTSYSMSVGREEFITAIKRVKVLANEKTGGVKLSIRTGSLNISSSHSSMGEASETIPVTYSGKDLDIGFSAKYLLDSFSSLDTKDILLEFNNELSPVILKSSEMPEYFGVIMPLRLQY